MKSWESRVPAPMPPPTRKKANDYNNKRYWGIFKGSLSSMNQRSAAALLFLWTPPQVFMDRQWWWPGGFALRTRGRLWWSVWCHRGLCLDTRLWLKNDFCSECFTPNAPYMDYLPTSGEKWAHPRGNAAKYSLHGAFGQQATCLSERCNIFCRLLQFWHWARLAPNMLPICRDGKTKSPILLKDMANGLKSEILGHPTWHSSKKNVMDICHGRNQKNVALSSIWCFEWRPRLRECIQM